ncbi:MAG: hypothetical protein VX938_12990, partial [Myxococcota bacterium]|nr:hypothetical protein [Myxococcota bacterium]
MAAETGSRWERPTGLGAAMLEPISGRFWDPEVTPRMMAGFVAELAEFTTIELRDEVQSAQGPVESAEGSSPRSQSLFGPSDAIAIPAPAAPVMSLAGTGKISSGALTAMALGGLPLTDQLKVSQSGLRPRATTETVILDDLAVDQRTPALAAGLMQSSQLTSDRGLSAAIAARHEDPAPVPGAEPVYGLYDAAESTFVGLADVDVAPVQEPMTAPRRGASDVNRVRLQDVAPTQGKDSGPLRPWTSSSSGGETRLASQVTHDRRGRPSVLVDRAGIAGEQIRSTVVPSTPSQLVDTSTMGRSADGPGQITLPASTQEAAPLPRVSPSELTTGVPTLRPTGPESMVASSRPALHRRPSLSSAGTLVSALEERRWSEGPGPEGFRPVGATSARPAMAAAGALDEGVWVAPESDESLRKGASIPSGSTRDPDTATPIADTSVRAALKRPVVTAREVLAAAPWVASLAKRSASSVPTRPVMPDLVRRLDDRHESLSSPGV